jgi:Domain of unknown function (DUF2427)
MARPCPNCCQYSCKFAHPLNSTLILSSVVGWFLGHAHKGRQFSHNIHSSFAPFVAFLFIGQVVFGIYLKFHFERGINRYIRLAAVMCHGTIGKITPIVSWVQMGFGGITLLGFCREDHLGQVCLPHKISRLVVSRSWNYGK